MTSPRFIRSLPRKARTPRFSSQPQNSDVSSRLSLPNITVPGRSGTDTSSVGSKNISYRSPRTYAPSEATNLTPRQQPASSNKHISRTKARRWSALQEGSSDTQTSGLSGNNRTAASGNDNKGRSSLNLPLHDDRRVGISPRFHEDKRNSALSPRQEVFRRGFSPTAQVSAPPPNISPRLSSQGLSVPGEYGSGMDPIVEQLQTPAQTKFYQRYSSELRGPDVDSSSPAASTDSINEEREDNGRSISSRRVAGDCTTPTADDHSISSESGRRSVPTLTSCPSTVGFLDKDDPRQGAALFEDILDSVYGTEVDESVKFKKEVERLAQIERLEREKQEAELAAEAARKLKAAEDEAAAGRKQPLRRKRFTVILMKAVTFARKSKDRLHAREALNNTTLPPIGPPAGPAQSSDSGSDKFSQMNDSGKRCSRVFTTTQPSILALTR
uniref:Uncharacterized protein n=1 Tax=Tetraselmis chuii TaxID=63592 RepID=A0A7S1SQ34_9CHLO